MTKVFSLASWNVEHFKGEPERVGRVVEFIGEQDPDVFGLFEVAGKEVYKMMVERMPGYQFHITEGTQTQETLVGVRGGITAFFTQRTEFKSGNTFLRPGLLVSLLIGSKNYSLLFLHTKSSSKPIGLGIRDDQFERAFKFSSTLAKAAEAERPNFIFLGDLNTMGMEYPFDHAISWETELRKLQADADGFGMRVLSKSQPFTWWNGKNKPGPSNLDQVVAAGHLRFKTFGDAEVDVRGWPQAVNRAEQRKWIESYSDHALLYLEILAV
ncbi:MAG: endonuclease/exonuclease/phosphatase family protein [candidate division WOR-3 bacterium]